MDSKEFALQFREIWKLAVSWAEISRRKGLLHLEDLLEKEKVAQRDIFHFGLRFSVDGVDAAFVNKILSNIINLETDKEARILKTIQKEAVLGIHKGMNLRCFEELLKSYVDIEITQSLNCKTREE